jgi:phage gp36-like protein
MGQFDNKQFAGLDLAAGSCDNVYYANRSDIELAFGSTNVQKWADLNNNLDDDEIDGRICWSLLNSHARINDRLSDGPYVIPFEAPYPTQIILLTSKLAGVFLYDSRRITDRQEEVKGIDFFRKDIEMTLSGILNGRYKLYGVTRANNSPFAIKAPTKDRTSSRFIGTESCT